MSMTGSQRPGPMLGSLVDRARTGLLVDVNPTNPTYEVMLYKQMDLVRLLWPFWWTIHQNTAWFGDHHQEALSPQRPRMSVGTLEDSTCFNWCVFCYPLGFSRCFWMDADGIFKDSVCVHGIGEVLGYFCCRCRDQCLSRNIFMLGLA